MKKEIAFIGLGKMGAGIVRQLLEHKWKVLGYNRSQDIVKALKREGMVPMHSFAEIKSMKTPRLVWLMLPAGKTVDEILFSTSGILPHLDRGDIVIDGGNSFYKDSIARDKKLAKRGIRFIDVGFSGGPGGARRGGCLMIGGDQKAFRAVEQIFRDVSLSDGYRFFSGAGAGHFVKMIHNGIEYGMMQAIGEGFEILKKSKFKLNLTKVAEIYNRGSVIESRLVGWLKSAFDEYGEELKPISSTVGHTGEGEWTAKTARELKVPAKIIEGSFQFRVRSKKNPSYTGKVVSALRGQFGGHSVKK
ncbi:decarboxylating 6-phosphogluconate dehydrogenase [Candidatus Kaiserbacteria bacterium]|nr:decarboxylating 6-phosphogluconate dehydrogenase [Candidatus Kaiserbacteria bacterium]